MMSLPAPEVTSRRKKRFKEALADLRTQLSSRAARSSTVRTLSDHNICAIVG
jgi:hypothetical protein